MGTAFNCFTTMKTRHILSLALFTLVLSACQKDITDMGNIDSPVLTLTEDTVTMHAGETHQLRLSYSISGVEWSSEHDTVASVDIRGLVTAHRQGTTLVTATRESGDDNLVTRSASCLIQVKE